MHPRIPLAFLAARAHCWLMVNLSPTRTPRSLSAELLSSRSAPSLTPGRCQSFPFLKICHDRNTFAFYHIIQSCFSTMSTKRLKSHYIFCFHFLDLADAQSKEDGGKRAQSPLKIILPVMSQQVPYQTYTLPLLKMGMSHTGDEKGSRHKRKVASRHTDVKKELSGD